MPNYIRLKPNKVKQTRKESSRYDAVAHSKVYTLRMSTNPKTNKPYTFEEIGAILGKTRQRVHIMYHTYVKRNMGKVFYREGGDE